MSAPNWSAQQVAALDDVRRWLRDPNAPQVYRLFGFAGTGKTTLARYLAEHESGTTIFAAYTGKAASVLRERGCDNATTLHSLLYNAGTQDRSPLLKLMEELERMNPRSEEAAELRGEIAALRARLRRPRFSLNPESILRQASLLCLDEVSMVAKPLALDVLSFKKKVLVLGDPAQLPPIEGAGYFINEKPNTLLTEIHRQAADNAILRLATMAREGIVIPHGNFGNGDARKVTRAKINDEWLARDAGQILCGKNATRNTLNSRVRRQLGRKSEWPEAGETLVCLRNNHQLGILNGVICASHTNAVSLANEGMGRNALAMDIKYEDRIIWDQLIDGGPFKGEEPDMFREDLLRFDYGYAVTVHKSQGSQWPVVTIYDDGFGKQDPLLRRRWLYTAITRAQHRLHIVTS